MDALHIFLMLSILALSIWIIAVQLENNRLVGDAKESGKQKQELRNRITAAMVQLDSLVEAAGKLEDLVIEQKKAYDERDSLGTYEQMDFPRM
jgi:hypothetical protein